MARQPHALPGPRDASCTDRPVAVQLLAMSRGGRRTLLLRHAERHPIRGLDDGWQAALTERGREDARRLGARLRAAGVESAAFYASPAPRCVDTARCIAEGLYDGAAASDVAARIHADPAFGGPYIIDELRAFAGMLAVGNDAFLRTWFDGGWQDAMAPANGAARAQRDALLRLLDDDATTPELRIVISHDWNIALLREKVLGQRHEAVGLPAFLDGITLFRNGGRVVIGDRSAVRWIDELEST